MAHYVLLYRGASPAQADLDLIEQARDVRVVDETGARALLVDASEAAARRLRDQLQGSWLVAEEVTHAPPEPARQEPRQGPK